MRYTFLSPASAPTRRRLSFPRCPYLYLEARLATLTSPLLARPLTRPPLFVLIPRLRLLETTTSRAVRVRSIHRSRPMLEVRPCRNHRSFSRPIFHLSPGKCNTNSSSSSDRQASRQVTVELARQQAGANTAWQAPYPQRHRSTLA